MFSRLIISPQLILQNTHTHAHTKEKGGKGGKKIFEWNTIIFKIQIKADCSSHCVSIIINDVPLTPDVSHFTAIFLNIKNMSQSSFILDIIKNRIETME